MNKKYIKPAIIPLLNYMVVLIMSICLYSCIKPVDNFEIRNQEPKLVVNAVFNPDSILKVFVSKSIGALDKEEVTYIENATVKLFTGNTLVTDLTGFNGSYYHADGFTPEESTNYKLTVAAPGYKSVEAHIKTVGRNRILKIDTLRRVIQYQGGGYNNIFEVILKFDHPGNEKNYYMVEASRNRREIVYPQGYFETSPDPDTVYRAYNINLESKSSQVEMSVDWNYVYTYNSSDQEKYGSVMVLSDKLFNGRENAFNFQIDNWHFYDSFYKEENPEKIRITLKSISEETFLFLKSYSQYSTDPFESFFSEGVTLFSNVINGIGLVTSEFLSIDSSLTTKPWPQNEY